MNNIKITACFFILALFVFSISSSAVEPQIIFSDNFEDGDITDWTTNTAGSGSVVADLAPGPDYSLNIDSPESSESKAMAISPSFTMDESADYNVNMEFSFESPIHWVEVFRNQHINAVIDNKVGDSWRFICRYDGMNYLVITMSEYTSYNIEYRVHPESNNYDIYVGDIFKRTCDCDSGGPEFPQFRVGDTEPGSSNYGNAFYDDFIIMQPPDSDGDGVADPNDNCPDVPNAEQLDNDTDGIGNACDGCPNDPNKTEPGICGCGVADTDSDGDQMPDCNDLYPADPSRCQCGDFDDSGLVNWADFGTFAANWLWTGQPGGENVTDLNCDGVVNWADFGFFAAKWLQSCP